MSLRTRGLLVVTLLLAACGERAKTPPARAPAAAPPIASAAPLAPSRPGSLVVEVDTAMLGSSIDVTAEEARRWAADPENAKRVRPPVRQVLVESDRANPVAHAAAKKKAEAILARLQRDGDWAKIFRESPGEPGSHGSGVYPGALVPMFGNAFGRAYDALAPGEMRKTVLETKLGWHVLKKDLPDDEARMEALRQALAPARAKAAAEAIAAHLGKAESIRDATFAVAAAIPAPRPPFSVRNFGLATPTAAPQPGTECGAFQAAPQGKVVVAHVEQGVDGWVVVKRGVLEPPEGEICAGPGDLTPEQQRVYDALKKQAEDGE